MVRQLRADARTRSLRVVAVTGCGQEADRRHAMDAGFDPHLIEPVAPELLEGLLVA